MPGVPKIELTCSPRETCCLTRKHTHTVSLSFSLTMVGYIRFGVNLVNFYEASARLEGKIKYLMKI